MRIGAFAEAGSRLAGFPIEKLECIIETPSLGREQQPLKFLGLGQPVRSIVAS